MKQLLRRVLERIAGRVGLTPEAIDILVERSETALVRADEPFCRAGQPGDVVVLILEGAGRIECAGPGQRTVIVQLVPPGQFVRLPTGRPGVPPAPALRAVAHVDSWVALIRTPVLANTLCRLPADGLLRLMAYSWRALSRHLYDRCRLPTMRLTDRLLLQLGSLGRDFGRPCGDGAIRIEVRVTHQHMAQLVGGSRAAVCRALGRLIQQGRLRVDEQQFVLPELPLRLAANGEDRAAVRFR